MKNKLSVVLATKNEEENISSCLQSVKGIADEIIVFDEFSSDKTRDIAKSFAARVFTYKHKTNFHETKQKAIDKASCNWILQLDADERVSPKLAKEIREVINLPDRELLKRTVNYFKKNLLGEDSKKIKLFIRHQRLIEKREGGLGKPSREVVAFFIPRRNFFLGKPLIHAGVYPDGVIRLIKRGNARLPGKSVHELMQVDGEVGWLFNDLEHHESPTLKRYLERMNRYTDLTAGDFRRQRLPLNYWSLFKYSFIVPTLKFLSLYIRHKGFLDGMRGFVWSVFSALHYNLAYFKYWQLSKK